MRHEAEPLTFVGANVEESIERASAYFDKLIQGSTDVDQLIGNLETELETKRVELEDALSGYDSFDTLAFLRMSASPADFTHFRESETRLETSQAAQDVVALALLGMGLPRQPLSGKNSGQPNPEVVLSLAADIIRAAQARALFRGRNVERPLGALAGEFLAYELAVRGRQYESIAKAANDRLYGDPTVKDIIAESFGFSLADIRSVRDVSEALMNEKFFGARDHIGAAMESEASPEAIHRDMNLMVNECRLFGTVSVEEVAARSGLDEVTVKAVLDFFSVSRPESEAAENPVTKFANGEHLMTGGCIVDKGEYLLLNGFLAEDELRRGFEQRLTGSGATRGPASKKWPKYDGRRAVFSESETSDALTELLAGTEARWQGQKYLGPASPDDTEMLGNDANLDSVATKDFESDLLFVVDGVALCVEVKAASVTSKARGGHPERLATDLQKTLTVGNEQADRLSRLVLANKGIWSLNRKWIDLSDVREIHTIIVMLDDMGPLSLSMNELADKDVIGTEDIPWIVSLHDLQVIGRTVEHPAQFLEYLRRRRGRKLAKMVSGADELDVFMWFLNGGMYFEPDPLEVASQIPLDRRVRSSAMRRYERQPRVRLGTLTDPLDAWIYGEEGSSDVRSPKPIRREELWVENYLSSSRAARSPGWLRFGADLVSLSEEAQRKLGKLLNDQRREARRGEIERSITTHGTTAHGSWLLTLSVVPRGADVDHLSKYMDDKQYQTRSSRSMLLLYKTSGLLYGSRYCDDMEPKTVERDAEVDRAPILSLSATFRSGPPVKKRVSKRKRKKRGKGRKK